MKHVFFVDLGFSHITRRTDLGPSVQSTVTHFSRDLNFKFNIYNLQNQISQC